MRRGEHRPGDRRPHQARPVRVLRRDPTRPRRGGTTAYTDDFGGTSGATPIIAGHCGLFFQMWADGIFGNEVDPGGTVFDNRPHMTTAKAVMINNAKQYPFTGATSDLTRVHQGWGWPNVQNVYDRREKMYIVNETELLHGAADDFLRAERRCWASRSSRPRWFTPTRRGRRRPPWRGSTI